MINVTVWNENLHEKQDGIKDVMKLIHPNGLHGTVADIVRELGDEVNVRTATLDQPEQGLSLIHILSTTKDFDSAVKLLLFCLRRYFKLSCLYIKEVFPDSKYAKISYLMHNGNFDDDLTCHELYAYGNDRSDDPIPEQKYCKLTADFNSDSYRKLLNEFNGGKTDIAAEYSIVNGNEIIGSIAAVREKSEAFWSRTETETLQKLTEIISPYILKKQYAGKFVHKYEGLNSEIVGVCSLSLFLERVARFLQDNPESNPQLRAVFHDPRLLRRSTGEFSLAFAV